MVRVDDNKLMLNSVAVFACGFGTVYIPTVF
jgi:hypothetical protein